MDTSPAAVVVRHERQATPPSLQPLVELRNFAKRYGPYTNGGTLEHRRTAKLKIGWKLPVVCRRAGLELADSNLAQIAASMIPRNQGLHVEAISPIAYLSSTAF